MELEVVIDEIWVRDTVNTNFMEGVLRCVLLARALPPVVFMA